MNYEENIAYMESERNIICENYFNARPESWSKPTEASFRAGFERGWNEAIKMYQLLEENKK